MATGSVFLSHLPRSKPISMLSLLSLHTDSPVLKWYATYLDEGAEGLGVCPTFVCLFLVPHFVLKLV